MLGFLTHFGSVYSALAVTSSHGDIALIFVGATLSIVLLLTPIVSRDSRYDPWASLALIGTGLSGIFWGTLAIFIPHIDQHNHWHLYLLAIFFKGMAAGAATGLILLLIVSGQFLKVEKRRKRYLRLKRFLSGKR